MAGVRFTDLQSRPLAFLDFTESREILGIMPQQAAPLPEGPCPDTNA
jgi:hypothetical protein